MKIYGICLVFIILMSFGLYTDTPVSLGSALEQAGTAIYSTLQTLDGEKKIAIYPFSSEKQITQFGKFLVDEIESNLLKKKDESIKVLNRDNMDTLLEEHEFQLSGFVDEKTQVIIGKKVSAHYIITGSYYNLGNSISLTIKIIDLKTGEILLSSSYGIEMDERIAALLDIPQTLSSDDSETTADTETGIPEPASVPEYVYIDTFDTFDKTVWKKQSVNKDLTLEVIDGRLRISGGYRQGRLNSINSITTKSVKHRSFAVEVAFRDVKASTNTIRLTVGNDNWMGGGFLQVVVSFKKEFYDFLWSRKGTWYQDDENFIDELFGDEDTEFHVLKIVYDKETKTAYGYVDDILIDNIPDFTFLPKDKINISISMSETVSNTKKDVLVEFDNFKCSLNLKK